MDNTLLEAALVGLKAQRSRLDQQIAMVEGQLGKRSPGRPKRLQEPESPAAKKVAKKGKRRKMSAEARARIAEAQRKRWAAYRKAQK